MTSVATASLDYAGASEGPAAAFKQRRADLNALKTALQSGDITGAQRALASVQQDMRTGHAHRHSQPTDVTSTTAAPTSISMTTADSTVCITQALVASLGASLDISA